MFHGLLQCRRREIMVICTGDSSGNRKWMALSYLRAAVLCSGEEGKEHPFCSVSE